MRFNGRLNSQNDTQAICFPFDGPFRLTFFLKQTITNCYFYLRDSDRMIGHGIILFQGSSLNIGAPLSINDDSLNGFCMISCGKFPMGEMAFFTKHVDCGVKSTTIWPLLHFRSMRKWTSFKARAKVWLL